MGSVIVANRDVVYNDIMKRAEVNYAWNTAGNHTRNSSIADKPRDAFIEVMQSRSPNYSIC